MKKLVLSLLVVACTTNFTLAQVGVQLSYGEYVKEEKTSATTQNVTPKGNDDEMHVVQKGQTLFSIASSYKTTPEQIKKLNNLSDNTIIVGQVLKVPKMRGNSEAKAQTNAAERTMGPKKEENAQAEESVSQVYHKVKSGETPYSIADTYQISIDELFSLNKINQESKIHVGDVLIVSEKKINLSEREIASVDNPNKLRGNGNDGSLEALSGEPDSVNVKSFEPIKKDREIPKKVEKTEAVEVAEAPEAESATKTVEFVSPAVVLGKTIEVGSYMPVEEETAETRYYGAHKNLPIGSIVNLHIPNNAGFVQVKIVNRLRSDRKELIGLSPACIRLIGKENTTATISY